jgi:ArsR family transcriptional regulator, arsenate/arsenite/antimonite-responsive transcriptional repressor
MMRLVKYMSMRIYWRMRALALFFAALADENRLRLLYLMKEGEICVCYLQGVLQTNQPKISRHLAYLKRAGLVEARRDGKWMYYQFRKLGSRRGKILTETLHRLENEPLIKRDAQRLKQIHCCPAKFGISPSGEKTARKQR